MVTDINPSRGPAATNLSLWFSEEGVVLELNRTTFRCPLLDREICAIRGKTPGAYKTDATFQWTTSVQAACTLFTRGAGVARSGEPLNKPLISGGKGSLAAALDASLYKRNIWQELFGAGVNGDPLSLKIIKRTNAGLRRAGPVEIGLNENILPGRAIHVFVNDKLLTKAVELLRCAERIESAWRNLNCPITIISGPGTENPLTPF